MIMKSKKSKSLTPRTTYLTLIWTWMQMRKRIFKSKDRIKRDRRMMWEEALKKSQPQTNASE